MAQTLTAYILEKATNSRSNAKKQGGDESTATGSILGKIFNKNKGRSSKKKSGGGSNSNTLTGFIFDYIKNSEKNKKSFVAEIEQHFDILSRKTDKIKNQISKSQKLYERQSSIVEEIGEKVNNITSLFQRRSDLEKSFFSLSIDHIEKFIGLKAYSDPIGPQPMNSDTPWAEKEPGERGGMFGTSGYAPRLPSKKLASGGVVPVEDALLDSLIQDEADRQTRDKFAKALQSPLRLSGLYALAFVKELIQSAGPISGFLVPFAKDVLKPFGNSLGVTDSEISRLINLPLITESTDLRKLQSEFAKSWYDLMTNERLLSEFIPYGDDDELGERFNSAPGYVPADWKDDPEFVALVNAFAQEWNLNARGLLALMASESGLQPDSINSAGCVGLIQFCPQGGLPGTGKTADEIRAMSRVEQWPYVTQYWINAGLEKGMTAGDIYGLVHVPNWYKPAVRGLAIGSPERMAAVTCRAGQPEFDDNSRLDHNQDGVLTVGDYDAELVKVSKGFNLGYKGWNQYAMGGSEGKGVVSSKPYVVSGPESGFPYEIFDGMGRPHKVTLHGQEIVVPKAQGFEVFPIKNKKYNLFRDPDRTVNRWKGILQKSKSIGNTTSAESGVSVNAPPEFWQIAAISAKEDSMNPQGQADVAQSIYNRAKVGSYPGGKNILRIITAPGQYQPTFKNPGAWGAIRDKRSAIAAVGSQTLVEKAARSITNPKLQTEAQRFIGGRTDFQGESQKKYMQAGDITRGKNHNFFGWFYDARLAKPAPVIKAVASQTRRSAPAAAAKQKTKTKTFTIPFTDIKVPMPFLSSSAASPPIYSETFDSRMTQKEMELIRLG